MHPWDEAALERRGRWIGRRSRLSPPIPTHESAGCLFFKAGCSQKGICISERSCFALPLTVFSFCLKAGLLRSAAKGAQRRGDKRQEPLGLISSRFVSAVPVLRQEEPLSKSQAHQKNKRLSRGLRPGHAHQGVQRQRSIWEKPSIRG